MRYTNTRSLGPRGLTSSWRFIRSILQEYDPIMSVYVCKNIEQKMYAMQVLFKGLEIQSVVAAACQMTC